MNDWDLPVAVTPKVKGIVDETLANFVGVVGGMAADDVMCEALKAADLLIGVGLDPVEIDSTWHAELPIQWILEAENVGGLNSAEHDSCRSRSVSGRTAGRATSGQAGRRRFTTSSKIAAASSTIVLELQT